MFLRLAQLIFFISASSAALAEPQDFVFDNSHADITFRISHLGYSSTHGRFNDFDGELIIDPDAIEKSRVNVTISTSSVETSFAKRNTHLKSEDFFNVEKFPTMTFVSTSVVQSGEDTATLTGDLTLLGNTQPVTLEMIINKIAPHPRSGELTAGITATGTINRSEWGMDKFVPGIADEVELRLDMEASVKES